MYLKEAFRYQNHLNQLVSDAQLYLRDPDNIVTRTQEHMRKKVNPEAEDEVVDMSAAYSATSGNNYTADQIVAFMRHIFDEKIRMTEAISRAKRAATIDIDAEVANNRIRQNIASTLNYIGNTKNTERMTKGYGSKFNAEGNQVQYTYDVLEKTEINFDRGNVKSMSKELFKQADEVSAAIDKAMVEIEIEYEPLYGVNDSFNDTVDAFLDSCNTSEAETEKAE